MSPYNVSPVVIRAGSVRVGYLCMVIAFAACLLSASTSMAADSREQAALADAWKSFYGDDIQRAGQLAEKLAESKDEGIRVEAMHLAARALWHTGMKKHREKAATIWKQLEKASTRNANIKRQSIAKALQLAAEDDVTGAVRELAGLLNKPYPDTCTLEAALLVAELRNSSGDLDKAKRACDFVDFYAGKLMKGNELSESTIKPFVDAADALRKRAGKSEAEWAFLAAEKLRKDGKHMEAIKAYRDVMKQYADTPFAPRSEYSIGLCLIGRGTLPAAVRHWQDFIKADATGAYRGQAYTGLIDLHLEHAGDVAEAAKQAAEATGSMKVALDSGKDETRESWQAATDDLHLRIGLLAYVNGDAAQAAESLENALANTERFDKAQREGLSRLITAAKEHKPLLPSDVSDLPADGSGGWGSGDTSADISKKLSPAAKTLGMGTIYNVLHKWQKAEALFDLVLADRAGRSTDAQKAYAAYGKAVSFAHCDKSDEAERFFKASLSKFKRGSWHDETLYALGTMLLQDAERKHGVKPHIAAQSATTKKDNSKTDRSRSKSQGLSEAELEKRLAEEQQRKAAYAKAHAESLPYWQQIVKAFPESSRREEAMFHVGMVSTDVAEVANLREAKGTWEKTLKNLQIYVENYPRNKRSGIVYLKIVEVALERLFDLQLAKKWSVQGVEWAESKLTTGEAPRDRMACPGSLVQLL